MSTVTHSLPQLAAGSASTKATTVGNYFVANYPPFGFWRPENAGAFAQALERAPTAGVEMGIYTHIPFCRKRCHFCYFRVYTDKNSKSIRGYIDSVLRELSTYAASPAMGGRKPTFLYFGGGTPSYLSPDQVRLLTDGMKQLVSWDEAREVTYEAEPGTLNETKLRTLRDVGVTRLSLGIEHMDDHVLETNGRAHRSKEVHTAYDFARSIGFDQINVDLIAGMLEETDEKWADTVAKVIALGPDAVTIYQMEVPYNSTIYKRMVSDGSLIAPVADWATKRRWVEYAFGQFEQAGYTVVSATTVMKNPKQPYLYRKGLFNGTDLFSVGVSAFGYVNGVNYQNVHDFDPYIDTISAGHLPTYRAYQLSDKERYIREFALQLKSGNVSISAFTNKFGKDPRDQFHDVLSRMQQEGQLFFQNDSITLSRPALMEIDRLIFDLFRPEHRQGRFA
jgi:oxygen-independent coproporphyrinogen-3 oxidase